MIKNKVVVTLAMLFFAISATAVVMPGADTRNAYKFKKDYEDAFKDKQSKIAALKFKKKIKGTETDNTGNFFDDDEVADYRHRDERQNADTLMALNSRNQPPTNTTSSAGDRTGSSSGDTGSSSGGSSGNDNHGNHDCHCNHDNHSNHGNHENHGDGQDH